MNILSKYPSICLVVNRTLGKMSPVFKLLLQPDNNVFLLYTKLDDRCCVSTPSIITKVQNINFNQCVFERGCYLVLRYTLSFFWKRVDEELSEIINPTKSFIANQYRSTQDRAWFAGFSVILVPRARKHSRTYFELWWPFLCFACFIIIISALMYPRRLAIGALKSRDQYFISNASPPLY